MQRKRLVFFIWDIPSSEQRAFSPNNQPFSEFLLSCLQNEKELVRNFLPKFRICLVEVHCLAVSGVSILPLLTFCTCPDRSWGTPSLLYNGYRVFPGGKERLGRDADPSTSFSAVIKKK
jgi:hypothetical protein